jgi:AbrB family looped-hinge helix DNA binding protein
MREHLTRVTRKGQITVPAEVRRALGLREGDRVAVLLEDGQARIERRSGVVARTAGIFRTGRPPLSPEQEQEAFERGVAEDVHSGLEP